VWYPLRVCHWLAGARHFEQLGRSRGHVGQVLVADLGFESKRSQRWSFGPCDSVLRRPGAGRRFRPNQFVETLPRDSMYPGKSVRITQRSPSGLVYQMLGSPRSVGDRTFPRPLEAIGRGLLPAILSLDQSCPSERSFVPGRLRFE
jgi:hypothetical protein